MHAIKRAARRQAYDDDGRAAKIFKFFGRIGARPRERSTSLAPHPLQRRNAWPYKSRPDSLAATTSPGAQFDSWTTSGPDTSSDDHKKATPKVETNSSDDAAQMESQTTPDVQETRSAGIRRLRAFLVCLGLKTPVAESSDGNIFTAGWSRRNPNITILSQIRAIFWNWATLLLLFVPAGFAVNYLGCNASTIFIVNFFAIVPSNLHLIYCIDQIGLYVGDKMEGLLGMTFSNAAQLISSILLLKTHQLGVLRASLLGSILQNILLMTGLAFFVGGCDRSEQFFNPTVAQTISMFLLLAVLSLMVPTISRLVVADIEPSGILAQSRGTAIVIMISYALWLIFQLKTNRALFDEVGQKAPKIIDQKVIQPGTSYRGLAVVGAGVGAAIGGAVNKSNIVGDPIEFEDPDEEEIPQLTPECATVASVIFTTLLAFNIQFATDSIQGLMSQHNLTDSFMGITILPILSNDITVLVVARMDKMDMALSLTLERAIQTSLMIVPIVILVAWGIGIDGMSLDFDGFSVASLFASVVIVTYVVQEGKSNWLTGALLVKVFIIISLAAYYIP